MNINSLLRYVGRPERVRRPKTARPSVRYATPAEFKRLLRELPTDDHRLVARVAFGTGARLGEVFALRRQTLTASVWIEQQLTDENRLAPTKTGNSRAATVIPEHWLAVRRWLAVNEVERQRLRAEPWAELVAAASERALGRRLVFHDLRHCYAVYWLNLGTPMKKVANCLGNALAVTDQHYASFEVTSDDEAAMLQAAKKTHGRRRR